MIKRIFHKSKASSANNSTQAIAPNTQANTNQTNLNVNQSTDQSILLRLKLQFENVVSLKHKQDHVASEPVTLTNESTDQIDENQKTMTSSDGQLLLEQYNQLNKQSETSIATKLNDLYNKQQELDEKLDDSQHDDEINSVLFKLPETSHSTNKIILTTDTGNDFNLSRRQSISMATTIEYPLRARILRHLSSSNAAQPNTGISCSSSSCSLFNKSSSSLYSSTACLCMANSSIASSTSNLQKQQTVTSSNPRNNLLNIDVDNSRRQSWGSYTHLNQNSKHSNNQATHNHHPKCPILTTRKQSTISTTYLHPNYNNNAQIVLQSSSSTSSTSSLLSTSHSSQSKLRQTIAHTTPKLLTPNTYRTSRMNSINSLNHFHKNVNRKDSEIVTSTNLFKFKNDKLGSSAPNLFVTNSKEPVILSRKNSALHRQSVHHGSIQINKTNHCNCSNNFCVTTSVASNVISSDNSAIQIGAQQTLQQSQQQIQQPSLLTAKNLDARRWSFASMHSSSSGYSGSIGAADTQTLVSNLTQPLKQEDQAQLIPKICSLSYENSSAAASSQEFENNTKTNCPNCSIGETNDNIVKTERRSRICSSSNESQLDDSSSYDGYAGFEGRSPINFNYQQQRQRARSLSCSPLSTSYKYNTESDMILLQNEKFKEKFPKACKEMEKNLINFIETNKDITKIAYFREPHEPAARFIHNQIIELANWCLEKSKQNQLTCAYFDEMTNSLEKLLVEASEKCVNVDTSVDSLRKFVKKFLLIVSRVARLLECLEFDPEEFCHLLNAAEAQARNVFINYNDIPKYIIAKLGLNKRDPFEEFAASINAESNNKTIIDQTTLISNENINNNNNDSLITNKINHDTIRKAGPTEDDFERIKPISNGAYGAVHLVRLKRKDSHSNLNEDLYSKRFAMKEIKKHNLILRNQLEQVFNERDIMIFTDNPFVVALICTFETKKHLCMVMEYVEGGDVATLIKRLGPLPLDMARAYFAETVLAVEYLHNYGIIHRDLKPDNLLITSLGHIKLTDFGLSKVGLMNLTTNFYEGDYSKKDHYCKEFSDNQIYGTPQYIAPEVILRQSYGKTIDWWSMGIILYEFLVSVTPFNGNTPEELFDSVINGEIEWPGDDDDLKVSNEAVNLINGLLAHDPMDRLGADGVLDIKKHIFFEPLDWDNLLRTKAKFIPELDGPDDTSYFDTRSDRYNHEENDEDVEEDDTKAVNLDESQKTPNLNKILDLNKTNSSLPTPTNNLDDSLTYLNSNDHNMSLKHENSCDTDTDPELFASFSSYSSKFKLCSNDNSISNSPVLSEYRQQQVLLQQQQLIQPIQFELIKTDLNEVSKDDEKTETEEVKTIDLFAKLNLETSDLKEPNDEINLELKIESSEYCTDIKENIIQEAEQTAEEPIVSKTEVISPAETAQSLTPTPTPTPALPTDENIKKETFINRKQTNPKKVELRNDLNLAKSHSSIKVNNNSNNNNKYHRNDHYNSRFSAYSSPTTPNTNRLSSSSFNSKKGTESSLAPLNRQYSSPLSRTIRPKSQLINPTYSNNTTPFVNTNIKNKPNRSFNRVSANQYNESAVNDMVNSGLNKPQLLIRRGIRGYGFTLRAIQVYYDDTDFYTIQHIVIQVDEQGPAYQAGLRFNDIITHVNDEIVCGKVHHEIVKSILSSVNHVLRLRTVNLNETKIKNNGRKRSPSKIKLTQPSSNQNISNVLMTAASVATATAGISTTNLFNNNNNNSNNNEVYFDQPNFANYSTDYASHNVSTYGTVLSSGNQSPLFNYNQANSSTNLNNQQQFNVSNNNNNNNIHLATNVNTSYSSPAGVSTSSFLNRRHIAASTTSVADYLLPVTNIQQQQTHERKKKTTLLRKLSEKRAHKYEFMQQQQLQQTNQQIHPIAQRQAGGSFKVSSSSSSSSSSSLNNSFSNHTNKTKCPPSLVSQMSCSPPATTHSLSTTNNKQRNVSTNDLRLSFYNNNNAKNQSWSDYTDQQLQQGSYINQHSKVKQAWSSSPSPFEDSPSSPSSFLCASNFYSSSANSTASNSPVNSQPNSPANRFNANSRLNSSRPRSLIVVKNSTPPPTAPAQSSANTTFSIYSMSAPQPAKSLVNSTQHFQSIHPAAPQIQHLNLQQQQPSLSVNQPYYEQQLTQNKLFLPNSNTIFTSTSSSFTSIAKSQFKPQSNQQQQQMQQLSPSPLAISDGMPISYGNSHVTQTFTPVNSINNNVANVEKELSSN